MRSRILLLTAVVGLVPAASGFARTTSATISLSAVANPVATTGCLAAGCQTYINPSWSFSTSDLRYQMTSGLNTSSVPCFAIHTDLGTLGALSGASGADTTATPQGAPESGGAWRTWCSSSLPTSVSGESQASLQIGSTKAGTATITAYLLRYSQLGTSFSSSIIAQTSFDLVFGKAAAKPLNQMRTYDWTLTHTRGLIASGEKGNAAVFFSSVTGSGTILVEPSGAVSRATGSIRFLYFLSSSDYTPKGISRKLDLKVVPRTAKFAHVPNGGLAFEVKVTATGSPLDVGDAECLAAPDGELILVDGQAARSFTLRDVCGFETNTNSSLGDLQLAITPR